MRWDLGVNFWMISVQPITEKQNNVVITDRMWARLLSSTNQPSFLRPKDVIEDEKVDEEPSTQLLDNGNCSENSLVSNENTK